MKLLSITCKRGDSLALEGLRRPRSGRELRLSPAPVRVRRVRPTVRAETQAPRLLRFPRRRAIHAADRVYVYTGRLDCGTRSTLDEERRRCLLLRAQGMRKGAAAVIGYFEPTAPFCADCSIAVNIFS